MDKSPEYIKMCGKAVEIQGNWELLKSGDYYYDMFGCFVNIVDKIYNNEPKVDIEERNNSEYIWLPKQDQLQEMMNEDAYIWFKNCWDYVQCEPLPLSAEMVGLERVMKEKYNKTWNGEDWI